MAPYFDDECCRTFITNSQTLRPRRHDQQQSQKNPDLLDKREHMKHVSGVRACLFLGGKEIGRQLIPANRAKGAQTSVQGRD